MLHEQHMVTFEAAPTLPLAFRERVRRTPGSTAYIQYEHGHWRRYSWQQTADAMARWQAALAAERLKPGERVAIMCCNRWEWVLFDQAALALGLVTVPIYTNDQSENILWLLHDSGARLLLIEGAAQWQLLAQTREQLEQLQRVVSIEDLPLPLHNHRSLHAWLPEQQPALRLIERSPDDLASIVYTSGTTGRPKGVMLSHRNILRNIEYALRQVPASQQDLLLSFLPLSHTLERTAGYYLPLLCGVPVAFCRGIPLLADDLQAIRPTLIFSVPRVFERVYARLQQQLQQQPRWRQRLFALAVQVGWQAFEHRQGRAPWSWQLMLHPLLDALVGRKIRTRLGGRLRLAVCGGAALSPEVARLFISLGVPIVQGYGLTETSPVIAVNRLQDNIPDSVGAPLPGIEIRISETGELLTRSECVMLGYWNDPAATQSIIDQDGWLHTGDLACLDSAGHLHITGRSKEIIVMSTGEKIPPGEMENAIARDTLVDQVMVVGEGRPFLGALLVPNPETFAQVAQQLHLDPANDATYLNPQLRDLFLQHVHQRTRDFPGYAQVHAVAVLREPWTPANGLMTPTLKLRRERILAQNRQATEQLYAGHKL